MSAGRPSGVSVVICVHNGAKRIATALAAIARQSHVEAVDWEVLIVDNASTDSTPEVARAAWPEALAERLRIVREERLGVAHARGRAFREARYAIVSFVDDDNWISDGWIAEVHRVFAEHPSVALLHTLSRAHFQDAPPPGHEICMNWLAVGSLCSTPGLVEQRPISFWTAGLSVRLEAMAFADDPAFAQALVGRQGSATLGGDDHELCLCITLAGWDVYYSEDIWFEHDLPNARFAAPYLSRLAENNGKSRRILSVYRAEYDPARFKQGLIFLADALGDLLRRGAAYYVKRLIGAIDAGVTPNLLSYKLARGRVLGYFSTAGLVAQARTNIALARRHGRSAKDPRP